MIHSKVVLTCSNCLFEAGPVCVAAWQYVRWTWRELRLSNLMSQLSQLSWWLLRDGTAMVVTPGGGGLLDEMGPTSVTPDTATVVAAVAMLLLNKDKYSNSHVTESCSHLFFLFSHPLQENFEVSKPLLSISVILPRNQ